VKLLKLWLPVVVWAGLIFYLSSIPDLKTGLAYDFLLRKIAHVIEYFIFTFLLYRAFNGAFKMEPGRLLMYPAGLALFYAALDEMHQYFVAGRGCSLGDVLIDSLGIVCFYTLIKFKQRRQRC
jgi:VanZ family protein